MVYMYLCVVDRITYFAFRDEITLALLLLLLSPSIYNSSNVIELLDLNKAFTLVFNMLINFGHNSFENHAKIKSGHNFAI